MAGRTISIWVIKARVQEICMNDSIILEVPWFSREKDTTCPRSVYWASLARLFPDGGWRMPFKTLRGIRWVCVEGNATPWEKFMLCRPEDPSSGPSTYIKPGRLELL